MILNSAFEMKSRDGFITIDYVRSAFQLAELSVDVLNQPRNVVLRFYKSLETKKKLIHLRDIVFTIILLTDMNEQYKATMLFLVGS